MLVEQINTATFSNGILRLEVAMVNARGEMQVTGNIEIPGNQVANVLNSMSKAAQDISNQLAGNIESNGDSSSTDKKDSSKNKGKGKKK